MDYTILDASNDFLQLSNAITKLEWELCGKVNIDSGSDDFRIITLDGIQQYLLSLTAYIRAFCALQIQLNNNTDAFLKILDIGIHNVQEFEDKRIIYKFPIEWLVTMVHFQIDSFFWEALKSNWEKVEGFYKRMTKVLGHIKIDIKEEDKIKNTLQCLASFRNSFHNSGVHIISNMDKVKWMNGLEPQRGTYDKAFESEWLNIIFKHKEEVYYEGRKILYLLIKESIDITYLIMKKLYY